MSYLPEIRSWPKMRHEAERIISKLRPLLEDPEDRKKGIMFGLFALVDPKYDCASHLLQMSVIWVPGMGDQRRAMGWVWKKALGFADDIQDHPHVISGFQTRSGKYYWSKGYKGGAFRVRCVVPELGQEPVWLVFVGAGIAQLADEAFGLAMCKASPWTVPSADLTEIAELSKNPYASALLA